MNHSCGKSKKYQPKEKTGWSIDNKPSKPIRSPSPPLHHSITRIFLSGLFLSLFMPADQHHHQDNQRHRQNAQVAAPVFRPAQVSVIHHHQPGQDDQGRQQDHGIPNLLHRR